MNSDLYKKTSYILNQIIEKKISIKSAIYNDKNIVNDRNFRKIYKLVNEIMKNRTLLDEIINNFFSDLNIKNIELFKIFLYEAFFSNQKKKIGGKLMKLIKEKSDSINKFLQKYNSSELKKMHDSKYYKNHFISFRLNNKKIAESQITTEEILKHLGTNQVEIKYNELYILDKSKADLKQLFAYADKGFVIFQNESSFLPVHILSNVLSSFKTNIEVIDSCAAPGNKTLQLADLFFEGKVTAFEKDKSRYQTFDKRVNLYNSSKNITIKNQDFLSIIPNEFPKVEVILCDPSCSGSGTLNNTKADDKSLNCCMDIAGSEHEEKEIERLKNLSKFQEKIVLHAMSFPNVKVVSYSTCSVYITENEYVVSRILKKNPSFRLKDLSGLNLNFHKGLIEGYENCIRTCSNCHEIDGFFIAIFEKINP